MELVVILNFFQLRSALIITFLLLTQMGLYGEDVPNRPIAGPPPAAPVQQMQAPVQPSTWSAQIRQKLRQNLGQFWIASQNFFSRYKKKILYGLGIGGLGFAAWLWTKSKAEPGITINLEPAPYEYTPNPIPLNFKFRD
jgi:hypothetical protein